MYANLRDYSNNQSDRDEAKKMLSFLRDYGVLQTAQELWELSSHKILGISKADDVIFDARHWFYNFKLLDNTMMVHRMQVKDVVSVQVQYDLGDEDIYYTGQHSNDPSSIKEFVLKFYETFLENTLLKWKKK